MNANNRANGFSVRCLRDLINYPSINQLPDSFIKMSYFHIFRKNNREKTLKDLFDAYFDARRNKRNTVNALAFEKNFESSLFLLFDEIINRRYKPRKSICFIVDKPIKREIFAADFRDRVIHHFIYNYISPLFEKVLVNDTCSCRKEKGVHYGIKRADHFIRSCSENYKNDCYILKLDIKGYFMSINKDILYDKVKESLMKRKKKIDFDLSLILYLLKETIFNNPTKDCIIKGSKKNWENLPKTKSLFHTKKNCGLPIGNLTSQLFGNVYLNDFDHFIKKDLKISYCGRYVDDIVMIHEDKDYLKKIIPEMREYLNDELELILHPNKIYLQHFSKGVKYLGAVIKSHRIYIASRTKANFYETIQKQNSVVRGHKPTREEIEFFLCSMNSYLGIMMHYKTYKLRVRILKNLDKRWMEYVYLSEEITKFIQIKPGGENIRRTLTWTNRALSICAIEDKNEINEIKL
jgi:hypothetical protein